MDLHTYIMFQQSECEVKDVCNEKVNWVNSADTDECFQNLHEEQPCVCHSVSVNSVI